MLDELQAQASHAAGSERLRIMFETSSTWSQDQRLAYQRLHLSQLLVHAKSNVPFYQTRLDTLFRRDGDIAWENWQQVPILTRADLRNFPTEMRVPKVPQGHGRIGHSTSSGSTGVPITINIPQLAIDVAGFAWNRFFRFHGVDLGQGLTEFKAFLPNGQPMTKEVLISPAAAGKTKQVWINRNLDVARKLDLLAEHRTVNLGDTTNHVEVLAHENLRRRDRVQISRIIGIGMAITPYQVELFRESFGALTLMPYSSKEGTLMAFQCAANRSNYHVSSELVFLEVVDEHGRAVPTGQKGRCVVTPFFNSAQPLIRYEQGDLVVAGAPCGCGITHPVLSEISGRSDAIFRFPDKMIAPTRFDDRLIQKSLRADAYQFAQVEPRKIVVRYVSGVDAEEEGKEAVSSHLLGIVQTEVAIEFSRVTQIPFNSGGKQQRVTREF